MAEASPILDWINLPPGAKTIQLWECLHDGDLLKITSDRLKRTVNLEIDVPYLREFHGLPDTLSFSLMFHNVQSARVSMSVVWPGEFSVPAGAPREEQLELVAQYHSKWREESISWTDFEAEVASGIDAEISDAFLAHGQAGQVAMKLGLLMGDGSYTEALTRAEALEVLRSDDEPFSIEAFLSLGEAYWKAFSERRV